MGFVNYDNATSLMTAIAGNISSTQGMIAPAFSSASEYASGAVVTYADGLYQFTTPHTAGTDWDVSEVEAITVDALVEGAGVEPLSTAEVSALVALLG